MQSIPLSEILQFRSHVTEYQYTRFNVQKIYYGSNYQSFRRQM